MGKGAVYVPFKTTSHVTLGREEFTFDLMGFEGNRFTLEEGEE